MTALDVIRAIVAHGGSVSLEDGTLRLRAPSPLPEDLRAAAREHKSAMMIALGAPMDTVVSGILDDIRPYLPGALQSLPDEKLLALVDWSILAAWSRALESVNENRL